MSKLQQALSDEDIVIILTDPSSYAKQSHQIRREIGERLRQDSGLILRVNDPSLILSQLIRNDAKRLKKQANPLVKVTGIIWNTFLDFFYHPEEFAEEYSAQIFISFMIGAVFLIIAIAIFV